MITASFSFAAVSGAPKTTIKSLPPDTNADVVYAVVNKAFSIGDDGTLTDITSSVSGTLTISLDNNIE